MEFTKKTITITKEQEEWVDKKTISLSRFVQKCLDKEMKKGE